MGQITSLFIRKVIGEVNGDIDKDAMLRSVGIDPMGPIHSSQMVPAGEYYALLERLAAADRDAITLPLRVGAAMRCDDYQAFGLAWKTAVNLRHRLHRSWTHLVPDIFDVRENRSESGKMADP